MIQLTHISKIYHIGETTTNALTDISFEIKKGEFVAIIGPSGSGKSTLMHIIGALDVPSEGKYILDGQDISVLSDDELAKIRNEKIGFVFQSFHLLGRRSATRNVELPMIYGRIGREARKKRAEELLSAVGLSDRMDHTPAQLSGGQKQRVAIARALSMNPSLILADEPTGNISTVQGEEIMNIFQKLNKEGHTIIIITHEPGVAAHANRILTIKDSKLVSDKKNTTKLK